MFEYPQQGSPFITFFNVVMHISLETSVKELESHASWIDSLDSYHDALRPLFEVENDVPELSPSPYQKAIYECEFDLLKMMRIVLGCAQMRLDVKADKVRHQKCIQYLKRISTSVEDNPYPIIRAFRMYLVMAAEIFDLSRMGATNTDASNALLTNAFSILMKVSEFKQNFETISYVITDHVNDMYFQHVINGIDAMIIDGEPVTLPEKFTFMLCSIFVAKLLDFRKQLVKAEAAFILPKKADKPTMNALLYQKQMHRDKLYQLDAIIRRLNLQAYKEQGYRTRYLSQAKARLTDTGVIDIFTYCHSIEMTDPLKFMMKSVDIFYMDIDRLELISASSLVLTHPKNVTRAHMKSVIAHRLENLYYKVNLLDFYRVFLKSIQSTDLSILTVDLKVIKWIALGLAYQHGNLRNIFEDQSRGFNQMIDGVSLPLIQDVFLGRMKSDSVTCAFSSLLKMSLSQRLSKANQGGRLNVVNDIRIAITQYMRIYTELSSVLQSNNSVMARQFILDYFCNGLMLCQSSPEALLLLSVAVDTPVLHLLDDEINCYLYEFTYVLLIKVKTDGLDHQAIDVDYLAKLEDSQIDTLYNLATLAIDRLSIPVCRIHSDVRAFFFKQAKNILAHIIKVQDKDRCADAEKSLKKLDQYLNDLALRTEKILNDYSPENIKYFPVTLDSDKKSFLSNTIAETAKRPVRNPPKPSTAINKASSEAVSTTVTVQAKKTVTIDSSIDEILASRKNNVGELVSYIKNHLASREHIKTRMTALLRFAECIPKVSPQKRSELILEIEARAVDILKVSQSYMTEQEYADYYQKYLDLLPKKQVHKQVEERVVAPVLQVVAARIPVQKAQNKKSRPVKTRPEHKQVSAVVTKPAPTPPVTQPKAQPQAPAPALKKSENMPAERKRVVWKFAPIEPIDAFDDMFVKNNHGKAETVLIKYNEIQQNLVNLLSESGLRPMIHGGAVVDTLLGVKKRDIDLLCFATPDALIKLLESHQDKLAFQTIRLTQSGVCVIKFSSVLENGDYEEIEVATIRANSPEERPEMLLMKCREFGVNLTLYCDAVTFKVIDPCRQYQKLIVQHILDHVLDKSHHPRMTINDYFAAYPERILDCIYKLAKYQRAGVAFTISNEVITAIHQNKHLIGKYKLIATTKFDKLFLLGHAVIALHYLQTEFKIIEQPFPMLAEKSVVPLSNTCSAFDYYIKEKADITPNAEHLNDLRADFLAAALFPGFISGRNLHALLLDPALMLNSCTYYLRQARIFISTDIISLVHQRWANELTLMHRLVYVKQNVTPNSLFQPVIPVLQKLTADDVPEAYVCIITQDIMKKPVYCWLDRKSYEESAITRWLSQHRTSPYNRKMMRPDQKLEDVLQPNDNLADAIEEFLRLRSLAQVCSNTN